MLLSIRPRLQGMSEEKANLKLQLGAFSPPDWPRRAQGAVKYVPLGYGTAALAALGAPNNGSSLLFHSSAPLWWQQQLTGLHISVLESSQLETESTLTRGAGSTHPFHTSLSAACLLSLEEPRPLHRWWTRPWWKGLFYLSDLLIFCSSWGWEKDVTLLIFMIKF